MHPHDFLSVFHGFIFFLLYGSGTAQRRGLGRGGNQVVDFDCPEEFGYYPHPTDCTQYYVCVFGGALLESCTGGLMYSHELQTCDWPRNVGCDGTSGDSGTISTVRVTDPRTRTPPQQRSSNSQHSLQAQQPIRTSQREEAQRQRQQEYAQPQPRPQQVIYEDELGPAEEEESDRQQRVYRGQPSTLGQVQRDRDGLRPIKGAIQPPNAIPSGPGTVEKVSLVTYGGQRDPRPQEQYRVEPEQIATTPAPLRYNTTARYQPSQYDPYYAYQPEQEIYRGSQYSDQQAPQQQTLPQPQPQYAPSSTARPSQQYRGQSTYKQQAVKIEPQRDTYSDDIYGDQGTQDYDEPDEQQYQQLASPKPSSRGTRPTLKPSTSIVSQASDYFDVYKYPPSRPENLYPTPIVDKSAAKCRKDVCLLPDCSCGGKEIPGGLSPEQTPQIVLLTFDDSVNDLNKQLYADLFERGRTNPNGCPISATFYVSHEWTDYSQVQNLYANGHEIASHTVSHSFGEQFSQKKWTREVAGQREILAAYGGVRLEDVRGLRAPFLAVGGNKMFKMLYDSNFTYDSSMPIYENKPPSWPYTLDYKIFHDCMIPPCPTKSYPGVWEVPMVMWQDLNGGRCSMGDACSNPPTADGVYKMLIKNFERHFTSNRAPFGLFYHAAWFTHEHHKEGFIAFLDTIVNMPEVWLVTNWQAIQWVRDPQPLSSVNNFAPFQCNEQKAKVCKNPKVCNLWHKSGVRYMRTCQPCPEFYPWTGKTGVLNSRVENEIIDE